MTLASLLLVLCFPQIALGGTGQAEARTASNQTQIGVQFQRGPGPKFCPGPGPFDEEKAQSGHWNVTRALVGRSLAGAIKVAASRDCFIRVVKRDGKPLVVTDDLRFNRINVAVVKRSYQGRNYWKVKRIVDIA